MLFKNSISINKGKKGLMFGIIIALLLFGFGLPQDFDTSSLQWTAGMSGKLMKDETLAYKGYSIEAVAFPAPVESQKYKAEPDESVDPFVGLNISKNGYFMSKATLRLGASYITPDGELKITVKELPNKNAVEWILESYAPWAIIELNPRGTPNLAVSILTDKDAYASSPTTDIIATVELENRGSADAVNIDMVLEAGLQVKSGALKYHYDMIKRGEKITETITFQAPVLAEQKSFGISANVSGYDVKAIPYPVKSSKSISMAAEIPVSLSVHKSTVSKMYLKDYTIITLFVKNTGRYDAKNVKISDTLPDSFYLLGTQEPRWIVDIHAGGEWENRYLVRPAKANKQGVVFPPATAEFVFNNVLYVIPSNQPTIVVHGPDIDINKQTDISVFDPGDIVTVTVTAENTGSTYTRVSITDTIPDKTTLVSGKTMSEGVLEATKKMSFSYTIRVDSNEPVLLPAATGDYFEIGTKGRRVTTKSNELEILPKSWKVTVTPTPTVTIPTPTETITPAVPTPSGIVIVTPTPVPAEEPIVLEPLNTILKLLNKANTFLNSILFAKPQEVLSISKSTIDRMYLTEYADVTLSIKNNGAQVLENVVVTDSLPEGFNLFINQSLTWVIDIPPGVVLEYRYYIKPQQANPEGIVIPAAAAEFSLNNEFYSIHSNQPKIAVLGPYDVLPPEQAGKIPLWVYILISLTIVFVIYQLWMYKKPMKVPEKPISRIEHEDVWSSRGFELYSKGKYDEAAKAYDKAREIIHKNITEEK
jgi:uncharacterized repeat protein (TIGR01451 family)